MNKMTLINVERMVSIMFGERIILWQGGSSKRKLEITSSKKEVGSQVAHKKNTRLAIHTICNSIFDDNINNFNRLF